MKKKVVYVTQWVAKDQNKKYPHGWGFEPPIVEFSQTMDAAEASNACKELSNDEFECIGATAREFIDGDFEILGIEPGPSEDSGEWAVRDIDFILSDDNEDKIKSIKAVVNKYFELNPQT